LFDSLALGSILDRTTKLLRHGRRCRNASSRW
jgi:hypothetical protein